jgi:hypothetical protein
MLQLTQHQVEVALFAVNDMVTRKELKNSRWRELVELFDLLDAASVNGTETHGAGEQFNLDSLIDTHEAAEILHCTTRRVTQIHADLDGVKIGRTWIFRRQTVAEYADAKGVGGDSNRIPGVGRRAVSA